MAYSSTPNYKAKYPAAAKKRTSVLGRFRNAAFSKVGKRIMAAAFALTFGSSANFSTQADAKDKKTIKESAVTAMAQNQTQPVEKFITTYRDAEGNDVSSESFIVQNGNDTLYVVPDATPSVPSAGLTASVLKTADVNRKTSTTPAPSQQPADTSDKTAEPSDPSVPEGAERVSIVVVPKYTEEQINHAITVIDDFKPQAADPSKVAATEVTTKANGAIQYSYKLKNGAVVTTSNEFFGRDMPITQEDFHPKTQFTNNATQVAGGGYTTSHTGGSNVKLAYN